MKSFVVWMSLLAVSLAKDLDAKAYFTAGVFEKALLPGIEEMTPKDRLERNLNLYAKAVKVAKEKDVDILVFPEFALFPYQERDKLKASMENVPNAKKDRINPCKQSNVFKDRPILSTLSCLSKENNLYIVANLVDVQPCDETCDANSVDDCKNSCPKDGTFMYNTNVAFDRKGNLIARYHKNHPYFEELNTPTNPEYVTFKTDFGTFGTVVCFDSLFKHSVNLVEKKGIDHLLFLTHWFDDILPYNAIEWQQSWALANDINFIASNVHHPGMGTLGSGIYAKKHGVVSYTYNPDGKSKLVVGRVPLDDKAPDLSLAETDVTIITEDEVYEVAEMGESFPKNSYAPIVGLAIENRTDYRSFKIQLTRYTLKKLESGRQTIQSCHNDFCCTASYFAPKLEEDYYLAVFKGINDVRDFYKWEEESCILVRCDPHDDQECALLPPIAETVFEYVTLEAPFTAERVYPTVSKSSNRLAPKYEWKHQKKDGRELLSFRSRSRDPLLKVGLWGRCYSRDPPFVPYF